MKVGYDVSELHVYAELSPRTDFDPKQLESLKKGGVIEGFNTRTQTQPHERILAQNKRRILFLEFEQLKNQFVKGIPASLFKDRPADRFFFLLFSLFQPFNK